MPANFGALGKDWRGQRRMSQLNLGMTAKVSARHISFPETGRAKPSQAMVRQLSESLEIPRGDRNRLLQAAGFSGTYEARSLDDKELEYVNAAMDWTLERLTEALAPHRNEYPDAIPAVITADYRSNGLLLSFFSTISQFGSVEDIALADVKIELMFPANAATREALIANFS